MDSIVIFIILFVIWIVITILLIVRINNVVKDTFGTSPQNNVISGFVNVILTRVGYWFIGLWGFITLLTIVFGLISFFILIKYKFDLCNRYETCLISIDNTPIDVDIQRYSAEYIPTRD
jgi:hypothetical protein